ncbi:ATPase, T2SS/T4P/T4SS family [Enterocloster bolteae]|uniref:ATPase, T2SS/T4P/T4SS family n=1 Tax=Enterocloster bolteae TaxID=208479 RepID=UPI00210DA4F3|nr:ATPase, T2SS/T4P/T4SS family [Enterocloster bolteae]MCQ5144500.1 CpaF/VirB11 family protein [Enterocloster bolteae]
MLGENRSKAAFRADSNGSVQKVKAPVGNHEPVPEQPGKFEHLQFGPDYPVGDAGWKPPDRPAEKMEQSAEETPMKPPTGSEIPAPVAEPEPPAATEEPETPGVRLAAPEKARTLRTHDLFFGAEDKDRDFTSVLREVQAYLSKEYSSLVTEDTTDEVKAQIRRFAGKYIQDHRIAVEGMTTDQLIDGIYSEMAEFGFLTKYIYGEGIEEIDVNAWDDVEVQYSGGVTKKLDEHFDSPEHAINVVRRMLHVSGMVLDDASPSVLGHLSKNIRIAVLKSPIVDEDVGVAASIRIVNPQSMKKEDFVKGGTATGQMLDFLSECIRYGISVCVAGATSSGKTTLLGWLLTTIPDSKRIYSIENGSRELALVRRDEEGQVKNSVIHTLTRDSENERQRVDQIALLDMALRFNPDVIVVGEMRGPEANAAQEAARTGVAVVTTIHSMSCDATYRRMVSLCKRAVDMSDDTLMGFVTEAYPIVAFCKQLENKDRRLMEIMECEILPDGSRKFRPLFQYRIKENRIEDGKFIITGEHRQVSPISESLARRLMENGMPQEMLNRLCAPQGKEEIPA